MLWEVATGSSPYKDVTREQFIWEVVIQGKRMNIPSDVPDDFANLISSTWVQESNKRPTCHQLLRDIELYIENEDSSAIRTGNDEYSSSRSIKSMTKSTTSRVVGF
ncbi:hypothetical protein I4U23_015255 [Adineta vaga]|nr:hypothetical protein I4U23_015255 [Adineta vaga]